jgi:hypothetical protein
MCICNLVVTEHMCCVYSYQILQCSEHPSLPMRDLIEPQREDTAGHGVLHALSILSMDADAIRTLLSCRYGSW